MNLSATLRKYQKWLLLLPLWAALYFGGCLGRTWSYNYEMVITVDTPEGPKVGRAVRTLRLEQQPSIIGGTLVLITGEAVVVDLGRRGKLFALLSGPGNGGPWNAQIVFPMSWPEHGERSGGKAGARSRALAKAAFWGEDISVEVDCRSGIEVIRATVDAPPNTVYGQCPPLVTFRNLYDRNSAVMVSPLDLAATFGPGVRLRSVRVALTKDKPQFILARELPWFPPWSKSWSPWGRPQPKTFAEHFYPTNFVIKDGE